jgi:Phosphatidylethanolamine-binding protein
VAEWSLTSSAFAAGGMISRRHTCDGEDRSPPLSWTAPPAGSRSLALILDDPDAPGGRSSTGSPGASARTQVGSPRARQRRVRDTTTSARSATADPAHPAGTVPTATGSGSTPWPRRSGWRPAPAWPNWSRRSRASCSRWSSSSASTSADRRLAGELVVRPLTGTAPCTWTPTLTWINELGQRSYQPHRR